MLLYPQDYVLRNPTIRLVEEREDLLLRVAQRPVHQNERRVREGRDPGVQLRVVRVALGARRFIQVLGRLSQKGDLVDDRLVLGQDLLVPFAKQIDGRVAGEEPVCGISASTQTPSTRRVSLPTAR